MPKYAINLLLVSSSVCFWQGVLWMADRQVKEKKRRRKQSILVLESRAVFRKQLREANGP